MEQTFEPQDWTMVAEIELSYKSKIRVAARYVIGCSQQMYDFLHQIWNSDKIDFIEEFKVILLNRAGHVLAYLQPFYPLSITLLNKRTCFRAILIFSFTCSFMPGMLNTVS